MSVNNKTSAGLGQLWAMMSEAMQQLRVYLCIASE